MVTDRMDRLLALDASEAPMAVEAGVHTTESSTSCKRRRLGGYQLHGNLLCPSYT